MWYYQQNNFIKIFIYNSEVVKKKLLKGDSFGEFAFMTGQARTATAYSQEYSQLHKITRSDFLDVLKHYPDDYEIFCKLRDELIFSQNFQSLGQFCWTCHRFDHYASACPFTHYIPEVWDLVDNATILYSNQDRIKIQRYDRKHWPTRTNQKTLVNGLNILKILNYFTVNQKSRNLLMLWYNYNQSPKVYTFQYKLNQFKTVKNISMQRLSPLKKQSSILQSVQSFGLDSDQKVEFNKTESIQDDPFKQQEEPDVSQIQQVEQKDAEKNNLSSLQNKLNQYRDQQQYQIHQGLDYFDEPQNFKYYQKKFNYSNYKVFQGFKESQMKKQINIRKSFMPGTYT